MGATNSKGGERTVALKLCKQRKKFIKEAIESRYAFAVAHVAYVESLKNIGVGLRRYAEAEVFIESSISTSDKTPSHSSYPFASPSHLGGVSESPVLNGSPLSPSTARMSYMVAGGTSAVTVRMNPTPPRNMHIDDYEFSTLPPPPPPPVSGSSWDFFHPIEDSESFRFAGQNNTELNFDNERIYGKASVDFDGNNEIDEIFVTPKSEHRSSSKLVVHNGNAIIPQKDGNSSKKAGDSEVKDKNEEKGDGSVGKSGGKLGLEQSISKGTKDLVEKDVAAEREDPSEFITHRAKDFLSSTKDIEHRFFRASESGREVSRMLEANKIRVGYAEAKGKSTASVYLASFRKACCQGKNGNIDGMEHVTKVITWKRTTSSRSSSSRNALNTGSKDDDDDSGSDFMEEFCMISGSHSSSLERLFAWERKLYDEVKASETIRREYDRKCNILRHQFAKDLSTQVIDKTRAVVKDLHSRITVALHAVDSISKRIEKMRDDELLPQLLELIHGLMRMWRVMLECHHAQYITISLAYHSKSSAGTPGEAQKQIMLQLQDEVEYFGLSIADWINSHTSYVESLNSWLQNCILQPQERSKSRRALFSPRRLLAPSIFVLCRDWCAGIKSLPSEELTDAIRSFLSDLRHSIRQAEATAEADDNNGESECSNDDDHRRSSNLSSLQTSLTKVFDRLTKFSEASLKMCEDVKQKFETARNAYLNYRAPQRSHSV